MSAYDSSRKVADFVAKRWNSRTIPALYALSQQTALEAINSAKHNAPWEDQTTQARAQLFMTAYRSDEAIGFFVAHGVQYGVYLELANDGKYEILRPTINVFGQQFFVGVRRLLGVR